MSLSRANIAGLTSPKQQSEMKSILAGAWPPLKPLPVFRYETPEYRATIDFDKMRGEWVCRKISLPSNKVQELRGELREITLALPHGEAEMLIEGAEEREQESDKDTNRRLQAIRDWRENYENGARYFELRNCLSKSQRREIDDSLRLSLTARQLQFNSKNIAYVFDTLSAAGGRFAILIEFANQIKTRQETAPQAQTEGAVHEAEHAIDHDKQSLGISSRDFGRVLNSNDPFVPDQEASESCTEAGEFPTVSIKNVFPEQYLAPLAERMAETACEQFEIKASVIEDADSPSLVEHPDQEGGHSPAFAGLAAQIQTGQPFADRSGGSSSRFPVLEISAFHLAVFASLFLFGVIAFAVTMGRGPLGSRLREVPKSLPSFDAKSPTLPDQVDQPPSRIPIPPVASSDKFTGTNRVEGPTPSEEKSKENTPDSEHFADVRSTDSNLNSTTESKPSAESAHSPKAIGVVSSAPRGPAPSKLTSTIGAASHLRRPSTILVNIPGRGSQPFRVSFPEHTIAAAPSLTMSSELSVLVSSKPGSVGAHKSARLKAGELVSFVWPHYPRLGDRYGLAQVIRVRATIGPLGQVRDVKFLNGSTSLLPATTRALRQWRYTPTLLDKRPVQSQQDLTIEFRPPQYSSQASTRHPTEKLMADR